MIDLIERAIICAALACAPRTEALAVGLQYVNDAEDDFPRMRRLRWLQEVSRWP